MHEMSIIQALMTSCEDHAHQHRAHSVIKVEVKIGVMSGVEPELLKVAFDTFKEKTICQSAELVLILQEVVVKCGDCRQQSTLIDKHFRCPLCKSNNLEIVDGEDMYLMSLEIE